eukprot:9442873-Ditylum_brightwellii.AAC.1
MVPGGNTSRTCDVAVDCCSDVIICYQSIKVDMLEVGTNATQPDTMQLVTGSFYANGIVFSKSTDCFVRLWKWIKNAACAEMGEGDGVASR